jgi:hypothetical protein
MLRALIYLRALSAKNWLLARARRLRQPKYLLGAIVGCAYFYFFFFRGLAGPRPGPQLDGPAREAIEAARAQLPADWLPAMTALGALALLALLAGLWLVPARRAALGFTEAEIAFLFPAPVTRTALVHFRLLSGQLRSLVGALVMTLFTGRAAVLGGNAVTHTLGWWLVFATLSLHHSGARFTLTQLAARGRAVWPRRLAIGAVLAAVVVTTLARALASAPPAAPAPGPAGLFPLAGLAVELAGTAPLSWLLWPVRLLVAPFLALDAAAFLAALAPALGVLGLHYLWVVRRAVDFEDAALEHAQHRADRAAAWRSGQRPGGAADKARPGPFHLRSTGRPEIAFLWKNLLSTWPYFTVRVWLGCAAVAVAASVWLGAQTIVPELATGAAVPLVVFAAYVLVVGPQFARQDIRSDLAHADILKTYPLPGWQIILGQLLAPAAILTGVLWLLLLAAAILLRPEGDAADAFTLAEHLAGTLALALVAPALVLLQLLVPNAAALVFPGWFQATRTRGGGPEVMGQRMIFFFAQLLAMAAALLPAAAVAAGVVLALHWIVGLAGAVACAAIAVLAVLAGEVWCGVRWLGARFERLDLSAELRA